MKRLNRRGIAILLVMGLIMVFMPVVYFLSTMGSSQIKQALKFHEVLKVEAVALSGNISGYSKLRGYQTTYSSSKGLLVGDMPYDLTVKPTGNGIFNQNLFYVFSKAQKGNHSYILMMDAEQFPPAPNPPVIVLPHDYWNTVEPYDISLAADITSMENYRGQELLLLEQTRQYERGKSKPDYFTDMLQKKDLGLPTELKTIWPAIAAAARDEKL